MKNEVRSGCPFCGEKVEKRMIAEEGTVIAIRDKYPVTKLHTLILPRRHVSDYFDFTPEEIEDAHSLLQYLREASYPIFIVHQPVIVFIAFYAVQWEVGLTVKLLVVVLGTFAASLGLYELLVRRINPVRVLFGMKPRKK